MALLYTALRYFLRFKPIDFIAALIFISLSIFIIIRPIEQGRAMIVLISGSDEIYLPSNDKIYKLSSEISDIYGKKYQLNKNMVLEIKDRKARVIESSCKDKICVNMAWAEKCGDMVVCMPNSTAIAIRCSKSGDE